MQPGDLVRWETANGPKVGRIERITDKGIVIRLDSGKVVICAENSLKRVEHE